METQTKIYNFIDERIDDALDHLVFLNNEGFLSYSFISNDKFAISFNCHYAHPITPLSIVVFDIVKDKLYTFPCNNNANTYKQHVTRIREKADSIAINQLIETSSVSFDERFAEILGQKASPPNWVQEEIESIAPDEGMEK